MNEPIKTNQNLYVYIPMFEIYPAYHEHNKPHVQTKEKWKYTRRKFCRPPFQPNHLLTIRNCENIIGYNFQVQKILDSERSSLEWD